MQCIVGRQYSCRLLVCVALGLLRIPTLATASGTLNNNFRILKEVLLNHPKHPSSPGWLQSPGQVSVAPGGFATLHCRNSLPHQQTVWLVGGSMRLENSLLASQARLYHGNTTLRLGPLRKGGDLVIIGCAIDSEDYGRLPSSLGEITVESGPQYNAPYYQVAILGQPFELTMGYSGPNPPSSYVWLKNGYMFEGDGERVEVSHAGIIYSSVRATDAGLYQVVSRDKEREAKAFSILKVMTSITQSGEIETMSSHLALSVARNQILTLQHPNTSSSSSSSPGFSVMNIIRKMLFKASSAARQQGSARLQLEELLDTVRRLTGSVNTVEIDEADLQSLDNLTNCSQALPKFDCTQLEVLQYRTYDGTCNNLFFPRRGATMTAFPRLLPAQYEDGLATPVGYQQAMSNDSFSPPWPSPRLISWRLGKVATHPAASQLTHMVMQWGQFLDHDLDLSPVFDVECECSFSQHCSPISVAAYDGTFGHNTSNHGQCLPFARSIPACQLDSPVAIPRNHVNQITSFHDASQVYGSSKELALSLRLMTGGLLKEGGRMDTEKGNLPFQEEHPENISLPFFVAGDERANEQTGLTVMHTVWLREHNRIARELAAINGCWNDERLYQEARAIVAAQMQRITYHEFLPTLFGEYMSTFIRPYRGYNPFIDASIPNSFAAAAYRFGHSLIRHSLLRLDQNYMALAIGHLDLDKAFFNPLTYFESNGTDPILRGLMVDLANPVDEFLNSVLTTKLFSKSPGALGGDLASLNIQRGRDHGLPSYRAWQQFCQRVYRTDSAHFSVSTEQVLRELYGEKGFLEGIDLWVGGLAEQRLPNAQLGPTLACILGISFTRLRDGDRFWYQHKHTFSEAQRHEVMRASLGKVVCDNADNIPSVPRNVFLADSGRVSCDSIPGPQLWRWLDLTCHSNNN